MNLCSGGLAYPMLLKPDPLPELADRFLGTAPVPVVVRRLLIELIWWDCYGNMPSW